MVGKHPAIQFERLQICPQKKAKQKDCPNLELTVIHAIEKSRPRRRAGIQWKLLTNLSVETLGEAL